jgi:hypothetical protein
LSWLESKVKQAKRKGINGFSVFLPGWLFILLCLQLISGDITCSEGRYSGSDVIASREVNPSTYWFAICFNVAILVFLIRRLVKKYF